MRFANVRRSLAQWRCQHIKRDTPIPIVIAMVLACGLITWYTTAVLKQFGPELWNVTLEHWTEIDDLTRLRLALTHVALYALVGLGCQFAFLGATLGSELKDRCTPVLREQLAHYTDAQLLRIFAVGFIGIFPLYFAQQYGWEHSDAINAGAGLDTWRLLGLDGIVACGGLVAAALTYVAAKEGASRMRSNRERVVSELEKTLSESSRPKDPGNRRRR